MEIKLGQSTQLSPFIKWAGGKRWLVKNYRELMPTEFARYYEPFLGGGAVFLHLAPKRGVLSDLNPELINVYKAIKGDWQEVYLGLQKHQERHGKDYYYQVRSQEPIELIDQATRFLYLNRTCWNGLYRVNLNGAFNVPIGTKTKVLLDTDDFRSISKRLVGVSLKCQDFEKTLDKVKQGDFVFIDPPYTVRHNQNGFTKYNQHLFSWDDQVRLRDRVADLASMGVKILVSNANHESIREIYSKLGEHYELSRQSVIAASSTYRSSVTEFAIKINY